VDFSVRARALEDESDLPALLAGWRDGRVKQALIARLLRFRQQHARLFAEGSYEPLATSGAKAGHLIAFARRLEGEALIVVVPRLTAGLGAAIGPVWQDTRIAMPEMEALDLLQPGKFQINAQADTASLLKLLPFAVLYASGR
jgi:maltooligosyltrehalose synthase